jgi:hypothetical protein
VQSLRFSFAPDTVDSEDNASAADRRSPNGNRKSGCAVRQERNEQKRRERVDAYDEEPKRCAILATLHICGSVAQGPYGSRNRRWWAVLVVGDGFEPLGCESRLGFALGENYVDAARRSSVIDTLQEFLRSCAK